METLIRELRKQLNLLPDFNLILLRPTVVISCLIITGSWLLFFERGIWGIVGLMLLIGISPFIWRFIEGFSNPVPSGFKYWFAKDPTPEILVEFKGLMALFFWGPVYVWSLARWALYGIDPHLSGVGIIQKILAGLTAISSWVWMAAIVQVFFTLGVSSVEPYMKGPLGFLTLFMVIVAIFHWIAAENSGSTTF